MSKGAPPVLEDMLPRRDGETDREWLRRFKREAADTRIVTDILAAAARGGVTDRQRERLLDRASRMANEAESARAIEAIHALGSK